MGDTAEVGERRKDRAQSMSAVLLSVGSTSKIVRPSVIQGLINASDI
jgi:hypothetical protein